MKKFTQTEFDEFKRAEDGYIHCPYGDYTDVDFKGIDGILFKDGSKLYKLGDGCKLGDYCKLGEGCKLGDGSKLGDKCELGACCELGDGCELGKQCRVGKGCELGTCCKLGDGCKLGYRCELGACCKLGDGCKLGKQCRVGKGCELGAGCEIGNECVLGDECKLGRWCELGKWCELGENCSMEDGKVENAMFFTIKNIGPENCEAYAFCNTKTGEIFFRAGCWFSNLDDFVTRVKEVHAGTQHETDYLAFVEFAKARFKRYENGGSKDA